MSKSYVGIDYSTSDMCQLFETRLFVITCGTILFLLRLDAQAFEILLDLH